MNMIDHRLRDLFRAIDLPADFETRVLARVRAATLDSVDQRATAARRQAEQLNDRAVRNLRQWHRAALRMFTLDALGGAVLLVLALIGLPHLAPRLAEFTPAIAVGLSALLAVGVLASGKASDLPS